MTSSVYINGRRYRLQPSDIIGQGGEATVYRCAPDEVVKVFIDPNDPILAHEPDLRRSAQERLDEHQRKLPAFPTGLSSHVITPRALGYDQPSGGLIVSYTMRYLDGLAVLMNYADRRFCRQAGIDGNQTVQVFRNLHSEVEKLHAAHVVIGDFNDLNVLVTPSAEVFLVDADSMQFGQFLCRTFMTRFVDPLHCEPDKLVLVKPHSELTDWHALNTMLFRSLLFVSPFGGVHRPKTGPQLAETARILQRITVFSPDVIYPVPALHYGALPDELLQHFTETFEQDKRGIFPLSLLDNLRWTTCRSCNAVHARPTCPACAAATPGAIKQTVTIHGNVTATSQFLTSGQIMYATVQSGKLRYVYHEAGAYKRENGAVATNGSLDRELRIRIWGDRTVLAKGTSLIVLGGSEPARYITQVVGQLPVFDANDEHLYWTSGEELVHDAPLGSKSVGQVLANQTLVWVGDRFGFGFFRAGALTRGLVFSTRRPGINDSVPLPPMRGNLIDATCTFASHHAWFMVTIAEGKDVKNHCYVINDSGELLAHAEAVQGDGSWLGESIRGRFANGANLFAATDEGIVRIGIDGTRLQIESYPGTKPFVNAATQLLPSPGGIVAVSPREIVLLQIR